jgi:hypothetical protein
VARDRAQCFVCEESLMGGKHHVDVIETGGSQHDDTRAAAGKAYQHVSIQLIVHKGADRWKPIRQRACRGGQACFEIVQRMTMGPVGFVEQLAIEAVGAEDRSSHLAMLI